MGSGRESWGGGGGFHERAGSQGGVGGLGLEAGAAGRGVPRVSEGSEGRRDEHGLHDFKKEVHYSTMYYSTLCGARL